LHAAGRRPVVPQAEYPPGEAAEAAEILIPLRWLAAAVSAAAFILAFPPYDLGWLAWGALVPLLAAVWRRPAPETFWTGYAWGLLAFGGVLWWLVGFGVFVWAFASALLAFGPAAALGAAAWAGRGSPRATILWLPVTWTAVEFLRAQGTTGFPWALLGESQHAALAVSQIASIGGVYAVSLLVAAVNAVGFLLLVRSAGRAPAALAAAALAGTVFYGNMALAAPVRANLPVGVVQSDYRVRVTADPAQASRDLATLDVLTHDAALPRPRGTPGRPATTDPRPPAGPAPSAGVRTAALVVWPETASPADIANDPRMRALIGGWARRDHTTLIATDLEGNVTNSVFAVAPDGVVIGRYDKHRLVPFAEAGERPGRGPAVLPTPAGDLGMMICFESTFPQHARDAVRAGAALLAVVTNDAWFGGRSAPLQHTAIAPLRAIEERRFLIRAANAGPSEIIDPYGRITARLPLGPRAVLHGLVGLRTDLTWYARTGDLVAWAAVAASAIAVTRRIAPLIAEDGRGPAFARLAWVSALPLAAVLAVGAAVRHLPAAGAWPPVMAGVPVPPAPLAALAAAALLSLRRSPRDVGFGRGFFPATATALGVTAVLAGVALRGFTAHGGTMPVTAPPGGWWRGGAADVLIVGFGLEWWLRGVVYRAAADWRGPAWAVGWSAVLGAMAEAPRGAEAVVWGLAAGLAFGIIRMRWAQVPALALAHGAGEAVFGFLFGPW
jgi:apolipoprotein N-acyltransferase